MSDNLEERIQLVKAKIKEREVCLLPPLLLGQVVDFETKYAIRLPEDYRLFVLNVGNGGDGPPGYGLLPLEQTALQCCGLTMKEPEISRFRPDLPFPLTALWVWEDCEGDEDQREDCEGDEDQENIASVYEQGHLNLGTDGCGMDWILVITGVERGSVWYRTEMAAAPYWKRNDFLHWYESWLDGETDLGDRVLGQFNE